MNSNDSTESIIPYYLEMDNIWKRLKELGRLNFPQFRSHYAPDGRCITEEVSEYLEQESLIIRWKELREYERKLDTSYCRNHLLVTLRLDMISQSLSGIEYDPTVAATIAISVYNNEPIN